MLLLIVQTFFEVQSQLIELFVGLPACFLFIILFLMQVYSNSFERQSSVKTFSPSLFLLPADALSRSI